jgi:hypothetical protein
MITRNRTLAAGVLVTLALAATLGVSEKDVEAATTDTAQSTFSSSPGCSDEPLEKKVVLKPQPKPDAGVSRFTDFLNTTAELGLEYLQTNYGSALFQEIWDPEYNCVGDTHDLTYVRDQIFGIHKIYGVDVARKVYESFMQEVRTNIAAGCHVSNVDKLMSLTGCFTPEERWDIHIDEEIRAKGRIPANFGTKMSLILTDIIKSLNPTMQSHAIRETCNQYPHIFTEPYTLMDFELDGQDEVFLLDHADKSFLCRNVLSELPHELADVVDYVNQDPKSPNFAGLAFRIIDVVKLEGEISRAILDNLDVSAAITKYRVAASEFARDAAEKICVAYSDNPSFSPKEYSALFFANVRSVANAYRGIARNAPSDVELFARNLVTSHCGFD